MKIYHGAKDGWLEAAVKTRPFGRLLDPRRSRAPSPSSVPTSSGLMTGANIDFDQTVVGASDPPIEP